MATSTTVVGAHDGERMLDLSDGGAEPWGSAVPAAGSTGGESEASSPTASGMGWFLASVVAALTIQTWVFGPLFGIGLTVMIICHEFGHYVVARRYGLGPRLPLLIPLIGGLVWISTEPRDRFEHAVVALAGPIAGSAVSLAAVGVGVAINSEALVRLGAVGIALNALNLLPLPPLDGGWVVPVISPWIWTGGIAAVAAMGAARGFHWVGVLVCVLGALDLGIWLHARITEGPPPPVPFVRRVLVGSLYVGMLGGSAYLVLLLAPGILSLIRFP